MVKICQNWCIWESPLASGSLSLSLDNIVVLAFAARFERGSLCMSSLRFWYISFCKMDLWSPSSHNRCLVIQGTCQAYFGPSPRQRPKLRSLHPATTRLIVWWMIAGRGKDHVVGYFSLWLIFCKQTFFLFEIKAAYSFWDGICYYLLFGKTKAAPWVKKGCGIFWAPTMTYHPPPKKKKKLIVRSCKTQSQRKFPKTRFS